jgi:hypothetical protein
MWTVETAGIGDQEEIIVAETVEMIAAVIVAVIAGTIAETEGMIAVTIANPGMTAGMKTATRESRSAGQIE